MPDIPLRQYTEDKTQFEVASAIGITQSGLSQMLRSSREIYVRLNRKGQLMEAYEIRWIKPVTRPAR